MTIQELHYQFKLNMDRVDTLSSTDFNKAEIDWLLNEAQLIFVKRRYSPDERKRLGFEFTQKRTDDLSTLVVKYPEQGPITPSCANGVCEVPLAALFYDYLFLIDAFCDLTENGVCTKSVPLKFVQHDDYRESLRDPFNSPSFEFIPYNFGKSSTQSAKSSIYIYPSSYTVDRVYIEYIKKPSRVSYGNYTYIDGVVYPPATCELPEQTHQEVVDIACQIASYAIENPEYIRLKAEKTFIHE
jgi:hypothetical protein